jgi:hypothetical protein
MPLKGRFSFGQKFAPEGGGLLLGKLLFILSFGG